MDTALDIRRLRLTIDGNAILSDVSLAVRKGEYLAIVGPNGAGKTSLLRCAARILSGWGGRIRVMGDDVERMGRKDLARRVAYVPQAGGRISPFTAGELVMMGRYPHLSPFTPVGGRDRAEVDRALERTGTTAFADRPLDTLSGGERQKIFIAAALAQEAPILLLDEPTTFLDPGHEHDIRRILRRANREDGATIVLVTHDLNAAALESDRILGLKEGATAFYGPPGKFMTPAVLRGLYGRDFLLGEHPDGGQAVILPERAEP